MYVRIPNLVNWHPSSSEGLKEISGFVPSTGCASSLATARNKESVPLIVCSSIRNLAPVCNAQCRITAQREGNGGVVLSTLSVQISQERLDRAIADHRFPIIGKREHQVPKLEQS